MGAARHDRGARYRDQGEGVMPWVLFFSRFFDVGPRDRRWHVPAALRRERYAQWMNNRMLRVRIGV